jgi:hypothetical protein
MSKPTNEKEWLDWYLEHHEVVNRTHIFHKRGELRQHCKNLIDATWTLLQYKSSCRITLAGNAQKAYYLLRCFNVIEGDNNFLLWFGNTAHDGIFYICFGRLLSRYSKES